MILGLLNRLLINLIINVVQFSALIFPQSITYKLIMNLSNTILLLTSYILSDNKSPIPSGGFTVLYIDCSNVKNRNESYL